MSSCGEEGCNLAERGRVRGGVHRTRASGAPAHPPHAQLRTWCDGRWRYRGHVLARVAHYYTPLAGARGRRPRAPRTGRSRAVLSTRQKAARARPRLDRMVFQTARMRRMEGRDRDDDKEEE